MSQNYLNIIGNWGTSAQKGRERAQAEAKMELEALKIQADNKLRTENNEQLAEQRMSNLY